jgi:hypothetical protein
MSEVIDAPPSSLAHIPETVEPDGQDGGATGNMRAWLGFLEAYRRRNPLADPADPVQLEILNARWLHERGEMRRRHHGG